MGELIVKDDRDLRRVESAIASIQGRPVCDQMRVQSLLMALHAERSLLQGTRRQRPVRHRGSAAVGLIG